MHNQFLWLAGKCSKELLEYCIPKQLAIIKDTHSLIIWSQSHNKNPSGISVVNSDTGYSLLFGDADVQRGGCLNKLTPDRIWEYLNSPEKLPDLSGRFAALRFENDEVSLASDINAAISIYWAYIDGNLVISSDFWLLVSLLAPQRRFIDMESLYETIALRHFAADSTMLSEIKRLEPGHKLIWKAGQGKPSSLPYWLFKYNIDDVPEEIAKRRVEEVLLANTGYLLEDDRNPALLLSGGVDSGTLLGMIHKLGGLTPKPYTVRFAGSRYDETKAARTVANRYGVTLSTIEIDHTDMFDGAHIWGECCHDPAYNQHSNLECKIQEKIAEQGHDAIWDGDFADALYGPLAVYNLAILSRLKLLPRPLASLVMGLVKMVGLKQGQLYQEVWAQFGQMSVDQFSIQGAFPEALSTADLGMDFQYRCQSRRRFAAKLADKDPLNRFMILAFYISDRVFNAKSEALARFHGMKPRKPFTRAAVIHEAEKLPQDLRVQSGIEKYLLRRVAEEYLPKEIVYAFKVTFDAASYGKNFINRDPRWAEYVNVMLNDGARVFEYLDKSLLQQKISSVNSQDVDAHMIWRLVTLEIWFKKLSEQTYIPPFE